MLRFLQSSCESAEIGQIDLETLCSIVRAILCVGMEGRKSHKEALPIWEVLQSSPYLSNDSSVERVGVRSSWFRLITNVLYVTKVDTYFHQVVAVMIRVFDTPSEQNTSFHMIGDVVVLSPILTFVFT